MKVWRSILIAFLLAGVAGWALAQDAPSKTGSRPGLKAQPMKATQAPDTYGTTYTSFYRMGASEFTGMDVPGVDDWSDTYYLDGTYRRYGTIANAWLIGTPHLPSGAQLISIRVNDCVNSDGTLYGQVVSCNYYGSSCTELAPITTIQGCGYDYIDLSGAGFVVDNSPNGNQLVIRLVTQNTDGTDSFAGVTVEYQLQVSPAPAVATFNDVPTSDFGFQYIEALFASGITGGCSASPPLYCPDNFVTRRQMGIFIAKALGLHFQ
jgi:hypothetical protein